MPSSEVSQEYQVQVDHVSTLPEISIQIEPTPDAPKDLSKQAAEALRTQFLLRIPVESVSRGSLPRFEMKARRWKKSN